MKDFLPFLESLHAGAAAHLKSVLPVGVIDAVERSARSDWIDIDIDAQCLNATVAWLGQDQARDAFRRFTSKLFFKSPAIHSIAGGAVRLFGLSVGSFVRTVPLAFAQCFRDFGTMKVERGEGDATIILCDIATQVPSSYAVLFHGVYLGIYDFVGVEPQLDFRSEFEERKMVARFRW